MRLTSTTAAAAEGGTASFFLTRSIPAGGPLSVGWTTAGGTATSDEDFPASTGTVAWGAGESGQRTIEVPVTADAEAEGAETFALTLTEATGDDAAIGVPRTATATIAANAAGPTLQFTEPAVAVSEGGTAVLSVTRSGPSERVVSVKYATAPGTAGSADFAPTTGTLAWAAGDSSAKTIAVTTADDRVFEGEERFSVVLSDAAGGAGRGSPSAATVVIAPSDPRQATPPSVALGGARKQRLRTVRRKGIAFTATVDQPCSLRVSVRRGRTRIARLTRALPAGRTALRVKVAKRHRKRLRAGQKLMVSTTCAAAALKSGRTKRLITLKR